MKRSWRRMFGLVATTAIVVGAGCSSKPSVSNSNDEAKVSGTVTLRGKKATKGEVVFDPANHLRKFETARTAPIGEDGTYAITTLVGQNNVMITGPEASRVGAEYSSITYDVQPGENTYDIEFPPPDSP